MIISSSRTIYCGPFKMLSFTDEAGSIPNITVVPKHSPISNELFNPTLLWTIVLPTYMRVESFKHVLIVEGCFCVFLKHHLA